MKAGIKALFLLSALALASTSVVPEAQDYEVVGEKLVVPNDNETEALSSRKTRMSNGIQAVDSQFPWSAALNIKLPSNVWTICLGSLISSNFVLSARQCIAGTNAITVEAVMGAANYDGSNRVGIYSEYYYWLNSEFGSPPDIALFRLYFQASFTNLVQPIRLPSAAQESTSFDGYLATILGFGPSKVPGRQYALNYGNVQIKSLVLCGPQDLMICGGAIPVIDTDFHESGASMVIYESGIPTLVGVNVGTQWETLENRYTTATRVSKFLQYIKSVTGIPIR